MFELPHDTVVVLLGDALWVTDGTLDEGLEAAFEQLVDLVVIVVVVPDAEHALYVVPDSPSEARRVDFVVRTHGVVGQVVGHLELLVQEVTDVVVEPVDERVAVIVPGVVLHAEGRDVLERAALGEVLIDEAWVVDEEADVGVGRDGVVALGRGRQLGRLRLYGLEALRQLLGRDLVRLGALREVLHALHQRLDADLLLAEYRRRRRRRRQLIRRAGYDYPLGAVGLRELGCRQIGRAVAVGPNVLLVAVAQVVVELLVDATGEDEGRQRVEVRQDDYGVHHLGQRPAVRPFCQFL